jgi:hypothetical protein
MGIEAVVVMGPPKGQTILPEGGLPAGLNLLEMPFRAGFEPQ